MTRKNKKTGIGKFVDRKLKIYWSRFYSIQYEEPGSIPDTTEGFIEFICTLGPPPKNIKHLSIGRRDHDKPHTLDNICWQELELNQAEAHFRNSWLYPKGFRNWTEALTKCQP